MGEFYAWLGKKKSARNSACGDGHVEAVSAGGRRMHRRPRFCSTSSTSCAIWARLWIRFARAKWAACGPGPALHQGPEIHIAVAQGEPHAGWQEGIEDVAWPNKRLNTAYVLKESFGQLWSYEREGWARRFFENWRASLKWQRLKPYEKFAEMIDRHWHGVAAYCQPENKVSLGFVEGLNNKIRVIQRRAYGLRNEEYLRLKIDLHAAGAIAAPRACSTFVHQPDDGEARQCVAEHPCECAIAMDMMDNASALPTCPQRQQQRAADEN